MGTNRDQGDPHRSLKNQETIRLLRRVLPQLERCDPEYLLKRQRHRIAGRIEPGRVEDRHHLPVKDQRYGLFVRQGDVEEERLARDPCNKPVKDQIRSLAVLCKERPDLKTRMAFPPDTVADNRPGIIKPGEPEVSFLRNPAAEELLSPGGKVCRYHTQAGRQTSRSG